MEVVVALGLLHVVFRVFIAFAVISWKIFYYLVVAPIGIFTGAGKKSHGLSVGGKTIRIVVETEQRQPKTRERTYVPRAEPNPRPSKPPPPPAYEPSRNEASCVVALTQLGWGKPRAAEVARTVAQRLGPDAPLNDMVKMALQQLGTAA